MHKGGHDSHRTGLKQLTVPTQTIATHSLIISNQEKIYTCRVWLPVAVAKEL